MSTAPIPFSGRRESPYGFELVEHAGFFYEPSLLDRVKNMYSHFKPREDDVFVCSGMKTGTTWVKAIVASIMSKNRGRVLEGRGVHDLIPSLERSYSSRAMPNASTVIAEMPSPRLLGTHLPYSALPPQIMSLGCRIIYIVRNPKDTFVSHWKFLPAMQAAANVETTCPTSKEADSLSHIKKISDFLGQSSLTEEDIRHIDSQCSFQFLSNLDVNRNGKLDLNDTSLSNHYFFRKGEVGDWKNHFTPEMNSRLDLAVEKKLQEAGLFLKYEL